MNQNITDESEMKLCNHCGLCCRDPCTQINLTIGDVYRISEYLGISVEELFKEHIGINPFGDPGLTHYDLDLGLNLPCKFRVDEKCSIYSARPLNCRLFPYWVLAEAPPEKLKEILSEHKCAYDITRRKDYKEYKKLVGEVLLEEAEWFEMNKKVNITRLKGYSGIDEEDFRKKEEAKINLIKEWNKEKPPIELIKSLIKERLSEINKNTLRINQAEGFVK